MLDGRDGVKYVIEYNGKLNEKEEVGGSEIVITSLAEGIFNSDYGWYTFKGANQSVTFDLIVNDYQSTATTIDAGSFLYAPMKSFSGSDGYFFVDNFKMDGIKYKPQVNSTMVITNDGANVGITLNLFMDSGDELVVVYNGPIGEGSSTPAEPTKLETPSVSGLVAGNAATISWQAVAGAKDYSVSLNGTYISTVETPYIVLSDLEYSTTYSVSVVANPADAAVNSASDAGTASFTTEADPNGGEEPGEGGGDNTGGESFENWAFTATISGGLNYVTFNGDDGTVIEMSVPLGLSLTTFTYNASNANYSFTDVKVNGTLTTDVTTESSIKLYQQSGFLFDIDLTINGVHYTGTSKTVYM